MISRIRLEAIGLYRRAYSIVPRSVLTLGRLLFGLKHSNSNSTFNNTSLLSETKEFVFEAVRSLLGT